LGSAMLSESRWSLTLGSSLLRIRADRLRAIIPPTAKCSHDLYLDRLYRAVARYGREELEADRQDDEHELEQGCCSQAPLIDVIAVIVQILRVAGALPPAENDVALRLDWPRLAGLLFIASEHKRHASGAAGG